MNSTLRTMIAVLALWCVCVAPAVASWAYIPPEVLIAEADGVVVGKMTKVDAVAGTGVIAVSEVLMGPKDLKEVKAKFSAMPPGGPMFSTMITYKEGTEGVWILQKKDKDGAYAFSYPLLHQAKSKTAEMKAKVAAVAARKWSEPVNGLSASCIVASPPGRAGGSVMLFVFVKNAGKQPLRINEHGAAQVLAATLVAPDGTESKPNLYAFLATARFRLIRAADFHALAPGESRVTGFRYGKSIALPDQKGEFKLRVTYTNSYDGKKLGVKNAWTGRIDLPEATFKR